MDTFRTVEGQGTHGSPEARERGRQADAPSQIPPRGWRDIVVRVKREARDDNLVLIAGGVAFFALLALGPAMLAVVSIYGMVASPEDVARQFESLSSALPEEARTLLQDQLTQIAETSGGRLGVQAAIGIVLALYAASSAVKHLMVALSAIYDEHETRGFVRLRATALLTTIGAVLFLVLAVGLLAGGPRWVEASVDETLGQALRLARWPILVVVMAFSLAALYRYLPDRDEPRWRWVSWGAVVATGLWILASSGFSFYASRFGNYERTYGSMAAVIVTMLWLFLTALCILLGAQINAETEHQTARDSTEGRPQPRGRRRATVADTVGERP